MIHMFTNHIIVRRCVSLKAFELNEQFFWARSHFKANSECIISQSFPRLIPDAYEGFQLVLVIIEVFFLLPIARLSTFWDSSPHSSVRVLFLPT